MTRWRRWTFAAVATAAVALAMGACGKSRSSSGGGGPAVNEQVIAPNGFKIQITGADIPADPTVAASPPTVTFTVTDESGAPVSDLQHQVDNSPASRGAPPNGYPYINAPRFTLARLDPNDGYTALYLSNAGTTTQQAISVTLPRDATTFGQLVTSNGNGSYTFKLNPLSANPSAAERGQTFTVGAWSARQPTQDASLDASTSTLNFVPAGGAPGYRQVVALQACNTCHAPAVTAHGTRLGTQLCLTCHTSQTHDAAGTSVEFVELIHKIHYGADRPGTPYTVGTTTFNDTWINDVRNCTLCHQGANADLHFTAPSERACTTCHSIVKFDSSASATCATGTKDTTDCNHQGGAVTTGCETCHTPDKLATSHTSIFTIAQQWKYEIQQATVGQDRKPVVRVDVRDASNQPRDLANDDSYKNAASSLNVQFGWPPKDYTNLGGSTTAPGQPISVPVVRGGALQTTNVAPVQGQTGVYDVTGPVLPDGVTSFTAFMDGHPFARGENIPVVNAVRSFSDTGGTGDTRRTVVSVNNCDVCHGVVSAHGRNRNGSVETCVVCHNPHATDWQKRQGTSAQGTEQAIDFKVLIHGVHSADIRHDPLIVYGFNAANAAHGGAPGTPNEFPGSIPHGVANCNMCHVSGSFQPPLSPDAQDTTVFTNNTPAIQSDDVTIGKTIAVCTSCHDQVQFGQASPPLQTCNQITPVNSTACFHSGGAQAEVSCASCHQRGGAADVATVHNVQ